jgi:succinylglutamic semialdehyde dehydrogenase
MSDGAHIGRGDFIDGEFVVGTRPSEILEVRCPADRALTISRHPVHPAHVGRACEAARRALAEWSRAPIETRERLLRSLRERLLSHRERLSELIALEAGKPRWEARGEVDAMAAKIDITLELGDGALGHHAFETPRERVDALPLGVVGVIGPFNFPGHLAHGQIVPALRHGNTVVFKPSEKTPSVGAVMAELVKQAGFPPGVFNVVQGGPEVGALLADHEELDALFFTGSVRAGREIAGRMAHRFDCLLALELGGKNAALVLPDADLERATRAIAHGAFITAGQRCSATSRVFVHRAVADPLVDGLVALASRLRVGFVDDDVFMSALIDEPARQRFLEAGALAERSGFVTLTGGAPLEVTRRDGAYVAPAVRLASDPELRVEGYSDTELFAPDLAVHVVETEEQAIALTNASRFGLVAAIHSRSAERRERVARQLRVGVVHENGSTAGASSRLPFGGLGQSGNHRPAGAFMARHCVHPRARFDATAAPLPPLPGLTEGPPPLEPS